jgi:hypothetical protein
MTSITTMIALANMPVLAHRSTKEKDITTSLIFDGRGAWHWR